ncbi:DUF882 domain-containing protein [Shinella zoogloeoides]|uniref:DUF882 domain-containing protein n=1 Tax=Shinella zoogloeoides TaxID=352475 RepID=UPI00273D35D4|nr:DUF882 domain-containing protein [Shinella zoogloeoides]WLR94787.1 DUF882 domain-containing protein [Shinella zoogloeoides]
MKRRGSSLSSLCKTVLHKLPKALSTAMLSAALILPTAIPATVQAESGSRTLKLYFIHTKEKAEITFKRNGRYDQRGLKQINQFLRDWRRNEPTRMDPRLLDLVWEVYQKAGGKGYINVVSAYRSPATNGMLRSRSKGVAKKSQHMLGKAMDFYIPGVKLSTLRATAMKFQVGGVGYYPTSGSPFVHLDVGSVRAWPRMSRQELTRLFPDGKTMHVPTDGKPLPGYQQAVADYKRRVGANTIEVAGGGSSPTASKRKGGFLAALFGGGGDEDEEPEMIASNATIADDFDEGGSAGAKAKAAETKPVATEAETEVDFSAPVPGSRPAFKSEETTSELALVAPTTSGAVAALEAATAEEQKPEFEDLAAYKIPLPVMLGARTQAGDAQPGEVMTAEASAEDGEELAMVPVPGLRPQVELDKTQTALMAAAEADVALPSSADRSGLAALADPTTDDAAGTPVEMAALVSMNDSGSRSLSGLDAFDAKTAEDATTKGSRPKKKDADAANRGAIRTEPKLSQKILSQWALTQGRVATLSKPVKAPRFVSRTLRAAPTTVYLAGFHSEGKSIDTGRFSGTAVNFMEVRKFESAEN